MKFLFLLPGRRPICSEGRSRHRNTATRCSSNRRQQLAAAAAVCCIPNHLICTLAGTAVVVALLLVCTFWVYFLAGSHRPKIASAACPSTTLTCVSATSSELNDVQQDQHEKASLVCVRAESPSGLALVPCALTAVEVADYDVESYT